jgi:predicted HicB family RNase H-like nuclease
MTKFKKIPKFKTIAEEARFWDTHDVSDYLSEMKEVKMVYDPSVHKEETLTVRVQAALKRRLETVARSYGVSLSTLLRVWFIDKVKEVESSGSSK